MTSEQKRNIAILAAAAIAAYFLLRPTQQVAPVVRQSEVSTPSYGPADYGNFGPWIPGQYQLNNIFGPGGAPFILFGGDTEINIPDFMLGSLSRQYIPMFGFVGIAGVGAQ